MYKLPDFCVIGPLSASGPIPDGFSISNADKFRVGFILGTEVSSPVLSLASQLVDVIVHHPDSNSNPLKVDQLRTIQLEIPEFTVPLSREILMRSSEFRLGLFSSRDPEVAYWWSPLLSLADQSLRVFRSFPCSSGLPIQTALQEMERQERAQHPWATKTRDRRAWSPVMMSFRVELLPSGSIIPSLPTPSDYQQEHEQQPGHMMCAACTGQGGKYCLQCSGASELSCADCTGSGWRALTVAAVSSEVGGRGGFQAIGVPVISRSRCQGCGGNGVIPCIACAGLGKIRCASCGGLGNVKNYQHLHYPDWA